MKNTFLFFAVLMVIAPALNAQIKFGVKAGVNISNQVPALAGFAANGEAITVDGKSVTRVGGDFFADIKLANKLQLRPELGFSNDGFSLAEIRNAAGSVVLQARTFKLNYLTLPVQLLYTPSISAGDFWIGAGPYAAVLLGGAASYEDGDVTLKIGSEKTDDFKRFDAGISSTVGFKLKQGILIGSSFKQGLMDVTPGEFSAKNKNRVIRFFIGYTF